MRLVIFAAAIGGMLGIMSVFEFFKAPLGSFCAGFFFGVAICALAFANAVANEPPLPSRSDTQ